MTRNEPVRTFETPDVDGVVSVSIHATNAEDAEHPFYAIQYYHRDTFEDGTDWHCEREEYIHTEEYLDAVIENTWIPLEDIRTTSHPVAVGVI